MQNKDRSELSRWIRMQGKEWYLSISIYLYLYFTSELQKRPEKKQLQFAKASTLQSWCSHLGCFHCCLNECLFFSLFSVAIDLITLPSRTCHSRSINSGNRFTEFSNNGVRVNTYFQGQPRCGQWGWQYLKCHLDDLFCVGRVAQDSQADHILSEVNTAVIILWR